MRNIEFPLVVTEQDIKFLAEEYEKSESPFIQSFAERILTSAAEATREMCDTARAIDMMNPLGNIILRTKEIEK